MTCEQKERLLSAFFYDYFFLNTSFLDDCLAHRCDGRLFCRHFSVNCILLLT